MKLLKLLKQIDLGCFQLLIPGIVRIHKITGYGARILSRFFFRAAIVIALLSVLHGVVKKPTPWEIGFNVIWLTWAAKSWYPRTKAELEKACDQWETSNGFVPIEVLEQAPIRVLYITLTVLFFGLSATHLLDPWEWIKDLPALFMTLAYYTAALPFDNGTTIKQRVTKLAHNLSNTLQNLAPKPALTLIPISN